MKKALFYWYAFLLTLLVMTSCGKKPITTEIKESKTTNDTETKFLFKNQTFKSLEIKDNFAFSIPKIYTGATRVQDCDSLCNKKIREALLNANTAKTSGDNSYKFYYDKLNDQLVLNVQLGETVTQLNDSIKIKNQRITELQNNVKEVPVEYIPKPIKYLAGFGLIVLIYFAIKLILFIKSKIPAA